MAMSPNDPKTWAEVVEIAFKIGALVLAGGWTIFGFYIFRQREKDVADLRKVELEARQLELATRRLAVVRTEITATTHRSLDGAGYCILADVSLTNAGTSETRVQWIGEPPAFTIRHASFGPDGSASFTKPPIDMRVRQARDPNADALSHVLRAGTTERFAFAAYVGQPGVYLLSFRGALAPEDRSVSIGAGTAPHNPVSWTARRYVVVREPTDHVKTTNAGS
jgi:hypothetical protein